MASAFNALRQERFDLKAEVETILSVKAADRKPEQVARLAEIEARVPVLDKEIDLAAKFIEQETGRPANPGIPAQTVAMGKDREEEKPITMGQWLQGMAYQAAPHLASMAGYLMPANVRAALFGASGASSGVSADGGFLVRSEWSTNLLNKTQEASQLAGKCDNLPIGDGFDGIEAPYVNETSRASGSRWGGVQVYRAAEAASVTSAKPGVGKFELRLEDMKGLFYATDRVLRDATLLEALANRAFASEFAFKLDDEIIRGTGTGQCLGILNADCLVSQAKVTGQANDTVKAENVIAMHSRMLARNIGRAEWYINQELLPQLQSMSIAVGTAGGQLVYMPPGGLSQSPYGTLLGRPVNVIEQCSGLGDVGDIIFADFSEFLLISKPMQSASSMHVRFIQDEMTYRWTWPIIGKPKLASAITPYKATTATTLSPFVTLAAR